MSATGETGAARVSVWPVLETLRPALDTLWTGVADDEGLALRLGLCGATHGDGATTIALCVAAGLAIHLRQEVVLVEANLASPGLALRVGAPHQPGFDEVARGATSLDAALRPTDVPGLWLLPAGGSSGEEPSPKPTLRLAGPSWPTEDQARVLFDRLGASGRHVIVDGPPILAHAAGLPMLRALDRVALVVSALRTRKPQALAAWRALGSAGVTRAGSILNRERRDVPAWMSGPARPGQG